jgi:hypothetical protein
MWPTIAREGVVTLTTAQLAMLLEGLDWRTPTPSWKPEGDCRDFCVLPVMRERKELPHGSKESTAHRQ